VIGQAMLAGAGFGLGVALFWYGLRPPRPSLAKLLDQLRKPQAVATAAQRRYRVLAAPLSRLGLPPRRTGQDLALCGRQVDTFLAEQTAAIGVGALALPLVAAMWGAGGLVPLWLAIAGGLVGYRWTLARLQTAARARRDLMAGTLSVVQDLVAVAMAGGAGIDEALDQATGVCSGWAAEQLRHTMHTARLTRQPVWQALGELGEHTGVAELVELGQAIRLATGEGARIRTALQAHAATARGKATAGMETAARAAGVRMSMPVLLLALAYGLFLLYPALTLMRGGLAT
jgi:Flp pilus assembly protein TadB